MSTITFANSCSHVLTELIYNMVQHKKFRIMNVRSNKKQAKKKSFFSNTHAIKRDTDWREILSQRYGYA